MERLFRALWWGWEVVVTTKGFLPNAYGHVTVIESRRTDEGFVGHAQIGSTSVPLKFIESVRFDTTEAINE